MKYARVMLFISILLAASISGCLGGDEEDGEDDGRIGIEREDPGSVVISVDINDDGTRIMWIEGDYPWGENNRSFMVITDIDGGNREVLREGPGGSLADGHFSDGGNKIIFWENGAYKRMSSDGTGVEVLVDDIYGLIHLTDEFAIKWWGGNVTYNCSGGNVTERHSNYYKEELATGETINITSYYADWKALIKDVDPDRGKLLYSLYLLDHIDHDGNICGIWDFTPGIHEMSFDGSEKVLVIPSSRLDNETLTNPHYFMDGSCILFTSGGQYYPQQAYLFERDTGEIEKITDIDRTDHYYAGISVLGEQRVLISVTDSAGSPEFHVDTYQSLYIYDRRTNTTEAVYENSSLNVVSHSPDGRYLVCLSDFGDGDIVLFDVRE